MHPATLLASRENPLLGLRDGMKSSRLCVEGWKKSQLRGKVLALSGAAGGQPWREGSEEQGGLEAPGGESSKGSDPAHPHCCHPGAVRGEGPDRQTDGPTGRLSHSAYMSRTRRVEPRGRSRELHGQTAWAPTPALAWQPGTGHLTSLTLPFSEIS